MAAYLDLACTRHYTGVVCVNVCAGLVHKQHAIASNKRMMSRTILFTPAHVSPINELQQ